MHPCLLVDEIALAVASLLSMGFRRDTDPNLLHLALTCRALYEPAMDVLWADTTSVLAKLILCLPPDAAGVTSRLCGHSDYGAEITIFRRLVNSDWPRFWHYAKRIKSISFPEPTRMHLAVHEDRIEITHGTVDIILQSYPWFGPLLPNLRSISLSDYHSYLHLLLSPSVKALDVSRSHVSEIDVPKSIQTALVPLSLDPAQFEEIGIHAENMRWTPATTGEVEGQASLISCCTALRRLSTDIPLTLSAFAALASLTALRKLTLSSVVLDPSITTTPPRSLPFSALRELKLEGPMEDIPPLLARCHLPRLVWLDLTLCLNEGQLTAPLDTTPSPSAYCMDRIAEAICTFAALEALSIRYSGCTGPRRPVVHAAALLPLAALRRLRLVSVDDVYLTPGAVAALARAWPRLERVHMLCRWPWAEGVDMPLPDGKFPAGVVLTDLDPFVLHCPALQPQGVQVHVARNPPRELVRADVGMAVSWEQRKHHFDLKFSAYAADRWGGA